MKPNTKAQAAMEFLMTYGWAILAVLAAIAALAYFGVVNTDNFSPERCVIEPGFGCDGFVIGENYVRVVLRNSLGKDINISSITTEGCTGNVSGKLKNGKQGSFTIDGCSHETGKKMKKEFTITYVDKVGLDYTKKGSINGKADGGTYTPPQGGQDGGEEQSGQEQQPGEQGNQSGNQSQQNQTNLTGFYTWTTTSSPDFSQGTYSSVQESGGTLLLQTGKNSGAYTSKILDAGADASWDNLTITYPDYGEIEPGQGSFMNSNFLLMHFNDNYDDSAGRLTGSCTSCPSGVSGIFGNAASFDGSDDYIEMSSDLNSWLGGTASLSAWIKTSQAGNRKSWKSPGITGVESEGDGNDIFWGWLDNNGRIGIMAGNNMGAKSDNSMGGNWHHVVMTRSVSGQTKVYVDSNLEEAENSDSGQKTNSFYSIGRIIDTAGTHEYLDAEIDELAAWNRIISQEEVNQLYRRGMIELQLYARSCDDAECSGESFSQIPLEGGTLSLPQNRYFQYKIEFDSADTRFSAKVEDITVKYSI